MNSEEVSQQIEELEAIRKETALWRTFSVLFILAVVITCVGLICFKAASLAKAGPTQEEFVGHVKEAINSQILPTVTNSALMKFKAEIKPMLDEEQKKLEARLPELTAALNVELQILMDNLPNHATNIMEATYGPMVKVREDKIREMYPGVTDEKINDLMSRLHTEVFEQVDRITEELFVEHLVLLDQIVVGILAMKESNEPDLYEKDAMWELGTLVFEIVKEEFQGMDESDETGRMMQTLFTED